MFGRTRDVRVVHFLASLFGTDRNCPEPAGAPFLGDYTAGRLIAWPGVSRQTPAQYGDDLGSSPSGPWLGIFVNLLSDTGRRGRCSISLR